MMDFINKPAVKNTILSMLTLLIGGVCSALGAWNYVEDKFFGVKTFILAILAIVYVGLMVYYGTKETNLNKVNELLQKQNKAFEDAMIGLISVCKNSSTGINTTIHNITTSGKIDLQIWSFDKASNWVCEQIYKVLCDLHGTSKEFGVGYIRLVEGVKPEKEIYMSAYANQNSQKPTVFGKKRCIDDEHGYHDTELFKRNNADIEVLDGHEKINDTFSYETRDSKKKNKKKYSQYIAIPVFCNDTKMVGLLEIVCLNDTKLAENEKELNEIASKYFVAYAHFMLLLHKLEKALVAVPKTKP